MKKQGIGTRDEGIGKDKGQSQSKGKSSGRSTEQRAMPRGFVAQAGGGVARKRPVSAGPTLSARESLAKVSAARRVAFEILLLVGAGKGHSDELLHSARTEALSVEDRNLATALVMGVLRWEIALDARVKGFLERPDQRLAEPVALALRMGAFQLLHMDRIPAHAALSESVELCRAFEQPHATGMVNAVLRKVAAAQKPGTRIFESTAAFAERLGHPRWLVERWVAAYGRDAALKICEAGQREPEEGAMFAPAGGGEGVAGSAADSSSAGSASGAELGAGAGANPASGADLAAGSAAASIATPVPVMDDGSRLVAEIAAAAVPGAKRVWDCCAAPGGKTLMLALREEGAEVLATDVSVKRTAAMTRRLERYGYGDRVRTAVADASIDGSAQVRGEFDLILCDVPCSGTGTLARNPEIRLRLEVEDLVRQAARQRAILAGALKKLAPGGRLVYSTCSLEPEENEAVVAAVVSEGEFRRVSVGELVGGLKDSGVLAAGVDLESAVRDGALRTLPGVHGCDGFFAVVLERLGIGSRE